MSWGKPSDAAAEAAVWGLIETEAKKRKDEARAWLTEQMGPDLLAVRAVANGKDVGRASWVDAKLAFKVTDLTLFLEFVKQHYPEEIVTAVNPAFQKRYLSELAQQGEAIIDNIGTVVQGVRLTQSNPYVSVTKAKDAREKVAALLAGGQVSLDGLTAIEAPVVEGEVLPENRWVTDMEAGAIG